MREFIKWFEVQAYACNASNDEVVAIVLHVLQKGAEVIEARIAGQEKFSESEIILFLETNTLFENLMRRKLHQPFELSVTSSALEKIFQMIEMFPDNVSAEINL